MKLSKTQKEIIYGLVLGDGFLQATGKKNARLRIEHSAKQEDYVNWIQKQLPNIFLNKPKKISRLHTKTNKIYFYIRLQSNSSPFLGKVRDKFYINGKKTIPLNLDKLLSSRTLATWYMDDGHYYKRDKSAHIYLHNVNKIEQNTILNSLKKIFDIDAKIYCRPDRKACQINFTGDNRDKLFSIISPKVIPLFNYKFSNPVSTESENHLFAHNKQANIKAQDTDFKSV